MTNPNYRPRERVTTRTQPYNSTDDGPLRVMLLATNVDELGGVQRVIKDLAVSLSSRRIDVELVSLWELDTAVKLGGYPQFNQRTLMRSRWFESLLSEKTWEKIGLRATRRRRLDQPMWRSAAQNLRELMEMRRPTVAVAMDVMAAGLVADARASCCLKIAQYHNSFESLARGRDLERLAASVKEFDALVALTEEDAKEFRRSGFLAPVITHIPNSIEAGKAVKEASREKLVLAAGRYHTQKSFDLLLRAWALIPESVRQGWQLHLMGEGPERERLVQLAQRLFPGAKDVVIGERGDVRNALASASIFALSSQHEGFPMVLLEALSAGTPVIATNCAPGVREILADGDAGMLVPLADPTAFAAGLERLMLSPYLRQQYATQGSDHILKFSQQRVTDDWVALFAALGLNLPVVGSNGYFAPGNEAPHSESGFMRERTSRDS